MKILICSHYFLPSFGGVEKATLLLARYLMEEGHEATVITQIPKEGEDNWPFRVVRKPGIREMLAELKRADIVHMQGFVLLPFLLCKILGRPVVWAHHGYDLTCPKLIGWKDGLDTSYRFSQCLNCLLRDHGVRKSLGLILLLQVKRFFKHSVDLHVAPSRHILDWEGLEGRVIPNAVDSRLYSPGTEEKVEGRILFVGRLIEEKGVAVLLEALDLLIKRGGNYTLEIVGDGYKLADLRRMVLERGLEGRVHFAGSVPETELIKKIRRATVVCAPTLNAEPFGIVGLEAMSCGTPLVASNKGGFPEFSRGVALLVQPGEAAALAEALHEAAFGGGSSERGKQGRQRVLNLYDYRVIGPEYPKLYQKLLGKYRGHA